MAWKVRELSDLLIRPDHRELLVYWFGVPEFSDEWMDNVVQSSISNLDRRYSPKQHVETEAGRLADIFVWSPTSADTFKASLLCVATEWGKYVEALKREAFDESLTGQFAALSQAMERLLRADLPSHGGPSIASAIAELEEASEPWGAVHEAVDAASRMAKASDDETKKPSATRDLQYFLMASDKLGSAFYSRRQLLNRCTLADKQYLLVLGDAGTGKSHLLASVVNHARKRGQPALLLLGEHFTAADGPWAQTCRATGWKHGEDWLLGALNQAAILSGLPALICIDALNESDHRNLWQSHLNAFSAKLKDYPNVRLIVSCRSDFVTITLPPAIAEGRDQAWSSIEHQGFGEELFEAVANYFEGYRVTSAHFPPLIEEFRNPLFLQLFCEAFENQRLPDGPLTLERVMAARISTLTTKLQKDIDCSAEDVRAAILAVANLIRNNEGRAIGKEPARTAVNQFSAERIHSRSLYTHLRSSGILVEITDGLASPEPMIRVRFAFERFSDYFIATGLLDQIHSIRQLKAAWKTGGQFAWLIQDDAYWRNRGLLAALAIVIPERFGLEVADLVQSSKDRPTLLHDFLGSLPWRSAASFQKRSRLLLREASRLGLSWFLPSLLRVATIPGHPYNANFIHERLSDVALPERERMWTIPIAELTGEPGSVPSMIVTWALRVPTKLVSDDQALLVARILLWFLSSNRRAFRKRATLAAIRILSAALAWRRV